MDRMLKKPRYALAAVCSVVCACTSNPENPAGSSETSGATTGMETGPVTGATLATTTSAEASSSGDESTTDAGEICPAPEPGALLNLAGVESPDLMPGDPYEVDCGVLGWTIPYPNEPSRHVELSCVEARGGEANEVLIRTWIESIDAQLDALVGRTGLHLSFWYEGYWSGQVPATTFTLRGPEGDLIVLGYNGVNITDPPTPGSDTHVGHPWWLEPGSPEYESWHAPFGDMFARDLGCAARESLRQGIATETPWALQFETDRGEETLYDQSTATVLVDGVNYNIFVSNAYAVEVAELSDFEDTFRISFVIVRSEIEPAKR